MKLFRIEHICCIFSVLFVTVVTCVRTDTGEWKSAVGCPKENILVGELWLKHHKDGQCYKVNTKGPCGRNMIFIPYPSNMITLSASERTTTKSIRNGEYGFCECYDAVKETDEEIQFIKSYAVDCIRDKRTQIYVPDKKRCYSSFHQGPCLNSTYWLVLNETYDPVCVKNVCAESRRSSSLTEDNEFINKRNSELSHVHLFTYTKNGPCYQTMTQGFCPKNHILRTSKNHWLPNCSYISPSRGRDKCSVAQNLKSASIPTSKCKPGSRRDYLTGCSRLINPR